MIASSNDKSLPALDLEAVRLFLLVADLRSFTRAADAAGTTQSAVSARIKRLEHGLAQRLIERTPRRVRLSAAGSRFLDPARALMAAHQAAMGAFVAPPRRLAIGISDHLVGAGLPLLLKQIMIADPGLVIELRVALSRDLLAWFDAGGLDAAIVLRHDARRRDGEVLYQERFGWFAAPGFDCPEGKTLRLATQAEPCGVRNMVVAALETAGIAWTEVFVGTGVATIGAAVAAGLAVAAMARRTAPPGMVEAGPRLGLPPLPVREVMLCAKVADPRDRACLRTMGAAMRGG